MMTFTNHESRIWVIQQLIRGTKNPRKIRAYKRNLRMLKRELKGAGGKND